MDHTHPELHSHSAPPSGLTPRPEYLADPDMVLFGAPTKRDALEYLDREQKMLQPSLPKMQEGGPVPPAPEEPSIEERVAAIAAQQGISVPEARGQLLQATAAQQGVSLSPEVIQQFSVGLISLHDALAQGLPKMQTGGMVGMDLFEEGDQDVNEALNMMATVANPEVPDMPATNGAAPMMEETVEVTETITEDQGPNDFKSAVRDLKDTYKTEIRNYISEAGMEGIDRYLKRMDVSYNNELNNLRKQFKVEILDPEDMLLTEEFIAELMGASIPGMDDGGVVMTQEKLNELFGKGKFSLSDWNNSSPEVQQVWLNIAQIAKIEQDKGTSSSIDMTALNNLLQERRGLSEEIGEAARSGYASIGSTGGHFLGARSAGRQAELSARDAALADEIGLQKALLTAQAGGKGAGGLDYELTADQRNLVSLAEINKAKEERELLQEQWDEAIKATDGEFGEAIDLFIKQTGGKIPPQYKDQERFIPELNKAGNVIDYYRHLIKKQQKAIENNDDDFYLQDELNKWFTLRVVPKK